MLFLLILVMALIWAPNTYGYLDPGTGSYLIQILLAGILSIAFTLKVFWKQIKIYFTKIIRRKDNVQ